MASARRNNIFAATVCPLSFSSIPRFIKSPASSAVTWHTLNHGNKAELKRDRHGDVELMR